MGNWGIGLGGLAEGFERGVGIGKKLAGTPEEQRQRRAADATDEVKTEFDAQGGGSMDQFQAYLLPKVAAKMIQAGDLDGAKAWTNWATQDTNKRATKEFGQGMIAAQAGDIGGALNSFVKAGRTRGYGGDYEIGDPEKVDGGGWRVNFTSKNGQQFSKTFTTPDEVLKLGATYLNPETAFQQWREQQAAEEKRKGNVAEDTAKYSARKNIDLEAKKSGVDTDLTKYRGQKAIDTETKVKEKALGVREGVEHTPAEVATAEWLIKKGVATDPADAWNKVRQARENPAQLRAQVYNSALRGNGGDTKAAEQATTEAMRFLGIGAPSAAPAQVPAQTATGNGNKPLNIPLPQRPAGVPEGSGYSPGQRRWYTRDGRAFDENGQPAAQ